MEIKLTKNKEGELFINYRLSPEQNFTLYDIVMIKDIKDVED